MKKSTFIEEQIAFALKRCGACAAINVNYGTAKSHSPSEIAVQYGLRGSIRIR